MLILWEDNSALVVAKPAGLPTQAAANIESLETQLHDHLRARDVASSNPYIAFAHRLDRPVSGAVLVARNQRVARRFGDQFRTRKVAKQYLVAVAGTGIPKNGRWTDWMRKIPDRPQSELVDPSAAGAKEATLEYRLTAEAGGLSLLTVQLETGRMHQIRLQAASRGYPILGDALYGSERPFGPEQADPRRRAIALHAWQLGFHHPKNAKWTLIEAPLPDFWRDLPFDVSASIPPGP